MKEYGYKLPRLKAIRMIIAGPDVRTRNNAINWNTVVALNILTSIKLINYSDHLENNLNKLNIMKYDILYIEISTVSFFIQHCIKPIFKQSILLDLYNYNPVYRNINFITYNIKNR